MAYLLAQIYFQQFLLNSTVVSKFDVFQNLEKFFQIARMPNTRNKYKKIIKTFIYYSVE